MVLPEQGLIITSLKGGLLYPNDQIIGRCPLRPTNTVIPNYRPMKGGNGDGIAT